LTTKKSGQQTEKLHEVVYTPDSQLRKPGHLFKSMWLDINSSRELAWRLIVRDISAQYRQSIFGVLWAFIPPIVTALVFVVLNSQNVINIGETNIPYPAFVVFGTVLWQVFLRQSQRTFKNDYRRKDYADKNQFPEGSIDTIRNWSDFVQFKH